MGIFTEAFDRTDDELPALQGTGNLSGEIARNAERTRVFGEHVAALQTQVEAVPQNSTGK